MIELVSISKLKKLNYLIPVYYNILNDNNNFKKVHVQILYNYLNFSNDLHKSVNNRIKLIYEHYQKLNKICLKQDFLDFNLFDHTISEILIIYRFQKYYLSIIENNWTLFIPLINYFIVKYL